MALRQVLGHQVIRLTSSSLPQVKVKVPEQARGYLTPRPYRTGEASEEYIMPLPRGLSPRLLDTDWQTGPGEELNSRLSL